MSNLNKKTIIFIDWDDTLFPTTWISKNKINIYDPVSHAAYFMKLDGAISKFLNQIINKGKIFIVTNALLEWVRSTTYLLPNSLILLKHVKIISAREAYGKIYPNNMTLWKKLCFKNIANKYVQKDKINNIISIGDADYEYDALVSLNDIVNQEKYLKSVKLVSHSKYEHIMEQLLVLCKNIDNIIDYNYHLDLVFEPL